MSASAQTAGRSRSLANLVRTPKGAPRRGGRLKGVANVINRDIKEMVITALSKAGGVDYLVQCAHKQPVAFLGLVGRVLPLQLAGTGTDGAPIPISFEWAPAQPQIEAKAEPVIEAEMVNTEVNSASEPDESTT